MSRLKVDELEALEGEVVKPVADLLTLAEIDGLLEALRGSGKNVSSFGATGDGVADDTASIQAAVDSFDARGGSVVFPSGVFRITSPILINNSAVSFVGAGSSSSFIFADGCDALVINNSGLGDKERVVYTFLGFETNGNGDYVAIDYTGKEGSSLGAQLTVTYCAFSGVSNGTCWDYPIKMDDAKFSEVSSNFFRGNTSDQDVSSASVYINDSTDVKIVRNFCYWSNYGVRIEGFSEGITVSDSHFVPVNRGVSHRGTGNLVWVNNNHISANLVAVEIGNTGFPTVNHCQVNNNLIFKRTSSTNNFNGVASYSARNSIMGNEIMIPGGSSAGGSQNGIVLYADARMCRVVGNNLANMDTGILLQGDSDNNTVAANTYISCTNDLVANGTNVTSGKVDRSSLLYLISPFPVSDSTFTPILWNASERDPESLWGVADRSRLKVPSLAKKVKVSCNIAFEADSTGERLVEIRKNGSLAPVGLASERQNAVASSDCSLSTAIMNVNPGDYFQVYVRQTSGGSLDVQSVGKTWFSLEVVE